jgi:hypothetical protein
VTSIAALNRQMHAAPQWSLNAVFAGLPLALIALGPAISLGIGDRTLPVYASQIATAVLVIHIGFTVLARRNYGGVPNTIRWLLAATALLAIPLMWSNDSAAGVLAYFNFASGTVGGMAIAHVWKGMSRSYSWIDVGYFVFLIVGVAQLLVLYSNASSLNSLHQLSPMPWGVTSVVAGALVVASLVVMARSAQVGCHRKFAVTIGLIAIGVALLTLTRGAVIAACVGAVFLLWSRTGHQRPRQVRPALAASRHANTKILVRLLLRALAVLIPVIGFLAIERATKLRAQLNTQVYANIDIRFEMYRLAWEEFLRNPLTGTGWASFRETSLNFTGQSLSFAHNLVVSMLQIGGLLSVPYLVVLSFLAYRVFRNGGPYTAAVAASIAVSMTQPFFESTVCNLIIVPIIFIASLPTAKNADDDGGGVVTPRAGAARTRLRHTRYLQPETAP